MHNVLFSQVTMPLHPGDLEIAEAIFRLFDHKLIDYVVRQNYKLHVNHNA